MSNGRNISVFYLFMLLVLLLTPTILHADGESILLFTNDYEAINGGVAFNFYPSGYSDGWWWGVSDRHKNWPLESGSHETLSGEWAAAISYDGSHNNKAEWLPTNFIFPDWGTDMTFVTDTSFNSVGWMVWNNNRNARSRIYNPDVQVTIDYRLIDLGVNSYASLPFYLQGSSRAAYVNSERYILIQTYNIKNTHPTGGSNITGLKFYQMLNSLVTVEGNKSSTYSNADVPGLLAGSYDPCNTNSPAKFKYAITQWNAGDPDVGDHVDRISFSSTIPPDSFENGIYDRGSGGDDDPGYTTYDIKNSSLSGDPDIYNVVSAAGAMGWDMGTLTPGQTKSITVAVMYGSGPVRGIPLPVHNRTLIPNRDYPTIQKAINAATNGDVLEVDPGTYNEHVILDSSKANNLTIRSTNPADRSVVATTIVQPPSGAGFAISNNAGSTISGFTIRNASGCNGIDADNSTVEILNCSIDYSNDGDNINISGGTVIVSGCELLVQNSSVGIRIDAADVDVSHCLIMSNGGSYGIDASGDNTTMLTVRNCRIEGFYYYGIVADSPAWAKIYNNRICDNGVPSGYSGIALSDPYNASDLLNNMVYQNGTGIEIYNVHNVSITARNNTVAGNPYGLYLQDGVNYVTVKNCIMWDNSTEIYGTPNVTYCDVQDGYSGATNISDDPYFRNAVNGDYHITGDSPCKNTGNGTPSNETDIDGDPRIIDSIDRGADEYAIQGYLSLQTFISAWLTRPGDAGWNPEYDIVADSIVNLKDFAKFASYWGLPTGWNSAPVVGIGMAQYIAETTQSGSTVLCLAYDANTPPDQNGEVTVYVHTSVPLISMEMHASVVGDANITSAMSIADCNQYGWYPQYSSDPNIEPNGLIHITSATPIVDSNTVVGYFKLRPNSGQVNVAVAAESVAYDANNQPLTFSTTPLTIDYVPGPASVYLVCDGNMTPDPNTEVTVYVHTDVPLYSMTVYATVSGDANITTAMSTADCNQYGWESEWSADPYIDDVNGIVGISGGKWGTVDANTIVGYFKFMYHSGQVNVAITTDSIAYDANDQPVTYSTDPLIFGGESMQQQMMMQSSSSFQLESSSVVDVNGLVNWLENLWSSDAEVRAAITEAQWQQFLGAVESNQ